MNKVNYKVGETIILIHIKVMSGLTKLHRISLLDENQHMSEPYFATVTCVDDSNGGRFRLDRFMKPKSTITAGRVDRPVALGSCPDEDCRYFYPLESTDEIAGIRGEWIDYTDYYFHLGSVRNKLEFEEDVGCYYYHMFLTMLDRVDHKYMIGDPLTAADYDLDLITVPQAMVSDYVDNAGDTFEEYVVRKARDDINLYQWYLRHKYWFGLLTKSRSRAFAARLMKEAVARHLEKNN